MTALGQLAALPRLGRVEGPILGGLLVVAGAGLGGARLTAHLLASALLMTVCTMGFAYGLNGISDVVEDAINKPARPLVSGAVSPRAARIYVALLAVVSLVYPFFLYDAWQARGLVLGVLVVGAAYSLGPWRLKRFPPAATLSIALLLHLPLLLGLWHAAGRLALPPWLASTLAFCLAVLPLKDLEDAAGDRRAGLGSWAVWLGTRPLLLWCAASSALACLADVLLLSATEPRWPRFAAFQAVPILVVVAFLGTRSDPTRIYRTIVRTVVAVAALTALLDLAR